MTEFVLSEGEATALLKVEKKCVERSLFDFPRPGGKLRVPLLSVDGVTRFALDMGRGSISLTKATYQNRVHSTVVLLRLDVDGPPHTNPDGTEIACPHLHVYKEGYGDKWAYPVPEDFASLADLWQTLHDFMQYCNITQIPVLQRGLFP